MFRTRTRSRPALLCMTLAGGLLAIVTPAARAESPNLVDATAWTSTTGFAPGNPIVLWCNPAGGYVQQAIPTVADVEHTLTFERNVYGYFGGGFGRVRATVFLSSDLTTPIADSGILGASTSYGNYAYAVWPTHTMTFTPSASNITLRFTGNNGIPGCGNFRYATAGVVGSIVLTHADPVVDTDGDGVNDDLDAFPNDASEWADTDGDGVGDNVDAFPNDASEWADTDGDGVGDNADAFPNDASESVDTDGDGVGDNADALPDDPTETLDFDFDGIGDNADLDDDNDGVADVDDAFPFDATESADFDGDGVGDNADTSTDMQAVASSLIEELTIVNATFDDKDLANAIAHLIEAEAAFTDGQLTSADAGKDAFKALEKAIKDLEHAQKDAEKAGDVDVATALGQTIDTIVNGSRRLAQEAIAAATAAGGNQEDLDKAATEMDKAEKELLKQHHEHAIHSFGDAWEKAMDSLEP